MVMQVVVQQDDALSSPQHGVQVVLVDERNISLNSTSSARDTSVTCRNASLNNTRQTANTYHSILDLTRDDDDDDEDDEESQAHDTSIMFEDLHEQRQQQSAHDAETEINQSFTTAVSTPYPASRQGSAITVTTRISTTCSSSSHNGGNSYKSAARPSSPMSVSTASLSGVSSSSSSSHQEPTNAAKQQADGEQCEEASNSMLSQWNSVTDNILDSLCAAPSTTTCAPCTAPTFSTPCPVLPASSSSTDLAQRHETTSAIMQLLGCNADPTADELDHLWTSPDGPRQTSTSSPTAPKRLSFPDRQFRLKRLQQLYHPGTASNHDNQSNSSSSKPEVHNRRTRHGLNFLPQQGNQQEHIESPQAFVRSQTLDGRKSHYSRSSCANRHSSSNITPVAAMGLFDPLSMWIGGPSLEPISPIFDDDDDDDEDVVDGYDSDPELPRLNGRAPMTRPSRLEPRTSLNQSSLMDDEDGITGVGDTSLLDQDEMDEPPIIRTRSPPALTSSSQHSAQKTAWTKPRRVIETAITRDNHIQRIVQETLNTTWTLTWHPNPQNMEEFNISSKPVCINIWMERGTVLPNSGNVLEPQLMWRDAYQPKLMSHKMLNTTTTKPWAIRLLNTCRIVSLNNKRKKSPAQTLCRATYPLPRQQCSLILKTCNKQEFLLEAQSTEEMEMITEHWKMVVARFASLAVTEDVDTISDEFFHNMNGVPNVGLSPI